MKKLTHFDETGAARMVDVSGKEATARVAVAGARVTMEHATLRLIVDRKIDKGDVFGVARVAGIMAAKRTPDLIPMSHPLDLAAVEITFEPDRKASWVDILATVRTTGRTGVEMEALTAAAVAGLTIYDMCKSVDRAMTVGDVRLLKKTGGKS
ncbi:MAG: cyclic pyranopterin monophosphate synthase MoaC, partial [Nitrospirae bacterium]|nr:cyclic pyranopterin monophosphate synthase MoaC [Nitrospirota bacterium]